jgi:hypothetical protein
LRASRLPVRLPVRRSLGEGGSLGGGGCVRSAFGFNLRKPAQAGPALSIRQCACRLLQNCASHLANLPERTERAVVHPQSADKLLRLVAALPRRVRQLSLAIQLS